MYSYPSQTYIKKITDLSSTKKELNPLLVVSGDSDFLKQHSCKEIEKKLEKKKTKIIRVDAEKLSFEEGTEIFQQQSLFNEKMSYFIYNFEQNKTLNNFLSEIKNKNDLMHLIVLVSKGKSIPKAINKNLTRLESNYIDCITPKPPEFYTLINHLCSTKKISLEKNAVYFLLDQMGYDLVKLNNELNKLSFIFNKQKKHLTTEDITQYSSFLKEEQVFLLTKLLLEKKIPQAQNLVSNILQSQEQALSIIGVLAYFCRTALYLMALKDQGIRADTAKLRLPSFTINHYNKNIDKHKSDSLKSALRECADSDIAIKTKGKRNQFITISNIITQLE